MRYLSDTVVNQIMSDGGATYLQQLEGLRLMPYADGNGFSIGFGHFIESGEEWMLNGITQDQADSIFETDLRNVEDAINSTITAGLTQPEFDGLCMFAFDIGYTNFPSSSLARIINAGQTPKQIHDYWLTTWVGSPAKSILLARREKEADYAFPDTQSASAKFPWWLLIAGYGTYKSFS